MAAEFEKLASQFLDRLPPDSPDRPFLVAVRDTVTAYVSRPESSAEGSIGTVQAPLQTPGDGMAPGELYVGEPGTPAETPAAPEEPPPPAEPQRVHLHGRLGAAPRVRITPKAVKIATFPLAVRGDDGTSTTWWRVLAFNNERRKLADKVESMQLAKGAAVEVVGYPHEVERQGRDSTKRTETQVYAAVIKAR